MMSKEMTAMVAAQLLTGKIAQGLKPVVGSPLIKEAVDTALAIAAEIDSRDATPAAPAVPPAP